MTYTLKTFVHYHFLCRVFGEVVHCTANDVFRFIDQKTPFELITYVLPHYEYREFEVEDELPF